jgi:hypothetical protein
MSIREAAAKFKTNEVAYDVHNMKSRAGSLTLVISLPLTVLAAAMAWRSIERLYTAYLFAQGRTQTDDLTAAHIDLRLDLAAWGIVLGIFLLVSFLLRFWYRSKRKVV